MSDKYNLAIIDNSDALNDSALDAADDKMSIEQGESRGFSGLLKKIWKYNLAKEYYRQKEFKTAKKEILESDNLYIRESGRQEDHSTEMDAIVSRFVSEYDETIHTDAGETKDFLDEKNEQEKQVKDEIVKLVKDYASGAIDENIFAEEKTRIFRNVHDLKTNVFSSGQMYADNLLKIATQIKNNVEHGKKLEEMDLDFDVTIGKAKSGVRTEAQYNKIDKIVDKITKTKLGSLVNEVTVASAIGAAYCIASSVSKTLVSSKISAAWTFGAAAVLSSGIAAAKESKRLEDERRQHFRDMAKGKNILPESKRRQEMDKFRYETLSVLDLTNDLAETIEKLKNSDSEEQSKELLALSLGLLTQTESRIQLSDTEKIDLLSYSNSKVIEKERLDLDIERAKAKVEVRNILSKNSELLKGKNFDEYLSNLTSVEKNRIISGDEGVEKRNQAFKKMKKNKVAKRALTTFGMGLAFGAVAQEVKSVFDSDQAGAVESAWRKIFHQPEDHSTHVTAFESIRRFITGDHPGFVGGRIEDNLIGNTNMRLPEGTSIIEDGHGGYALVRESDEIVNNLHFNSNGTLTDGSREILDSHGMLCDETISRVTENTTPQGIIDEHKDGLFHSIKRVLHFDNDTKAFDQNELKIWWGGKNYTGIDDNGNYVFNVSHMTPGGSYHAGLAIDAPHLTKIGALKMIFSLSRDTQNMVCEVPIDSNGNAIIEKGSAIARLLFKTSEDGKSVFVGKFAEVVQSMGSDDKGNELVRIVSTTVGKGLSGSINVVDHVTHTIHIPTATDMPWFIPIEGRTPMERAYEGFSYGYGYGGNKESKEEYERKEKEFRSKRSETLNNDPSVKLNHYREADNYFDKMDEDYISEIESLANQCGEMKDSVKLSICMPAAGHQEGNQIYNTLENFTHQTANPKDYEICIFVNHPDVDKSGKQVKPDSTLNEVNKFKKDHPEMNVVVMYGILPKDLAKIGRVRKMLTDSVLYRHHKRGNSVKDLIIVSNDADNLGVAPEYVKNFINKFEEDENVDGMLGQLDWDPESYIKYPAIHIGTRLFQYLNLYGRVKRGSMPSSGANFAFRSSIYSAVGGYMDYMDGAEDVRLGEAIISSRNNDNSHIKFAGARVSRLYTSSRRAIDAYKSGLSPIEQWEKGFSAFDDDIRKFDLNKESVSTDYDSPEYVSKLKKQLEYVINRTIDTYESGEKIGKGSVFYRRALRFLGIQYSLKADGSIIIDNISNVIKNLKEYQILAVDLRNYKSGKISKEEFKNKTSVLEYSDTSSKKRPAKRRKTKTS